MAKTVTMQKSDWFSHRIVKLPSVSVSQYADALTTIPAPFLWTMMDVTAIPSTMTIMMYKEIKYQQIGRERESARSKQAIMMVVVLDIPPYL